MASEKYRKNVSAELDNDFNGGVSYPKVKLGEKNIFWRKSLSWFVLSFENIERIYRRVEEAGSKLACCSANFDIEKLMLVAKDGSVHEVYIGDGVEKEALDLYSTLKEQHPEIAFGKA